MRDWDGIFWGDFGVEVAALISGQAREHAASITDKLERQFSGPDGSRGLAALVTSGYYC